MFNVAVLGKLSKFNFSKTFSLEILFNANISSGFLSFNEIFIFSFTIFLTCSVVGSTIFRVFNTEFCFPLPVTPVLSPTLKLSSSFNIDEKYALELCSPFSI